MSSNRSFELVGFTGDDGNIGRAVPSGKILVPGTVDLDGDAIRWSLGDGTKVQPVSRRLLDDFIALRRAAPAGILRFARRWGVLGLTRGRFPSPCGEGLYEGVEPIAAWKYFSGRAAAVLNIAAAVKHDNLGDLADWSWISMPEPGVPASEEHLMHGYGMGLAYQPLRVGVRRTPLERARSALASEINRWMSFWKRLRLQGLSDFSISWKPTSQRWELQIDYHGYLFAAVALQIALVVAEADSLYTCSGCGKPYIRDKRKPKPGSDNYCDDCDADGVAERRAVESYREKKRAAVRLFMDGSSIPELAARFGASELQMKKWVLKGKASARTKTRK